MSESSCEQWKPIPGYEGHYEASDMGNVRCVKYGAVGRPMSHYRNGRVGHRGIELSKGGKSKGHMVHRLVLLAFVGAPPPGTECCHNNGNPEDNRLENLRWDSSSANARDRVRHGTDANAKKTHCPNGHEYSDENTYVSNGKRSCRTCRSARPRPVKKPGPRATLSIDQQRELIEMRLAGSSFRELTEYFGVSIAVVHGIFKAYAAESPEMQSKSEAVGKSNLGRKPKLTKEEKAELLVLRAEGWDFTRLAEHFKVSRSTACNVVHGKY